MKRNDAFIGSAMWVTRDVSIHRFNTGAMRPAVRGLSDSATLVRDNPSTITITDYQGTPTDVLLRLLAHRVRQLA